MERPIVFISLLATERLVKKLPISHFTMIKPADPRILLHRLSTFTLEGCPSTSLTRTINLNPQVIPQSLCAIAAWRILPDVPGVPPHELARASNVV
jgi:hypothetical protein